MAIRLSDDLTATRNLVTIAAQQVAVEHPGFKVESMTVAGNGSLIVNFLPPILQELSDDEADALIEGLAALDRRWQQVVNTGSLASPLPLVGRTDSNDLSEPAQISISSSLDLGQRLRDEVLKPASNYLVGRKLPTVNALRQLLTRTLQDGSQSTAQVDMIGNDLRFDVQYTITKTQNRELELGRYARELGFTLLTDPKPVLPLTTSASVNLGFGLDTNVAQASPTISLLTLVVSRATHRQLARPVTTWTLTSIKAW